jgi:hypothetical protein
MMQNEENISPQEVDKLMVRTSIQLLTFSLYEVNGLIGQMTHDLISPFSAISAGLEMGPTQGDDIWNLITRSKQQMSNLLELFRDLFGSGNLTVCETKKLLAHLFGDRFSFSSSSDALLEVYPRIALGLCFWLVRQAIYKKGAVRVRNTPEYIEFTLSDTHLVESSRQDQVLMQGEHPVSGGDFYACFVYHLLRNAHLQVHIERSIEKLVLKLAARSST